MSKRVINMKISTEQHNQLKTLSDKYGFTMTGYVQHLILTEWNKITQYEQINKIEDLLQNKNLQKALNMVNNNNKIR